MAPFVYREMFSLGEDTTDYRLLTKDHINLKSFENTQILKVELEGLVHLSEQAFIDVSHFLKPFHLKQLRGILDDSESSENDKVVAFDLLKNAVISSQGVFPMCQDTGTAIVIGKK